MSDSSHSRAHPPHAQVDPHGGAPAHRAHDTVMEQADDDPAAPPTGASPIERVLQHRGSSPTAPMRASALAAAPTHRHDTVTTLWPPGAHVRCRRRAGDGVEDEYEDLFWSRPMEDDWDEEEEIEQQMQREHDRQSSPPHDVVTTGSDSARLQRSSPRLTAVGTMGRALPTAASARTTAAAGVLLSSAAASIARPSTRRWR
jgi:hypothetical protein